MQGPKKWCQILVSRVEKPAVLERRTREHIPRFIERYTVVPTCQDDLGLAQPLSVCLICSNHIPKPAQNPVLIYQHIACAYG